MFGKDRQPRERLMIYAMITGVLFVILYYGVGFDESLDSLLAGDSDVSSLEGEFTSNLESLESMYEIESEFRRVGEFPQSEQENLKPALAFTQMVQRMCADHGFEFSGISPQAEPIEGVDEYELINVAIKTEGTFDNTVALLKDFEAKGMIFREMDLKGTRDRDIVVARVTVARIAEKPVRKSAADRMSRTR